MTIKMLVFDVDGTLYDLDAHCILDSTTTAIRKAKENGYLFVIASGRTHYELGKALDDLKPDYVLAASGSVLSDCNKKVITHHDLSYQSVQDLIDFAFQYQAPLALKCLDYIYLNEHKAGIDWLEAQINSDIGPTPFKDNFAMDIHHTHSVQGACMHGDPNLIHQHFGNHHELQFTSYSSDGFDIVKKGINKGVGVMDLINHLHIKKEEIACIGDNYNDIEMMKCCGYRIAMGNAVDAIKEMADFVTKPSIEDGIYHALKHLGCF